jgi:hypothetical protein
MMNMTIPIIRQRILVGPALVAESLGDFDSAAIVIESVNGFRLRPSLDYLPHARKWLARYFRTPSPHADEIATAALRFSALWLA